jgi:HNH endonuclease
MTTPKPFLVQLPGEDRPRGLCWCGCGQPTVIAKRTSSGVKQFKGVPARYLSSHNARVNLPIHLRLFPRLVIDPSGCLLWTGWTDRDGYGRIRIDGHDYAVHRLMYEMFVGPIPDGLEIDHVKERGCRNRNCASPAHLEPVTTRENVLRGEGRAAVQVTVTHCGTCGLPYDEKNTYVAPGTRKRKCRNCARATERRYRERKRSAA